MPEDLNEQPCRVAAGPHAFFKSFLTCLYAWIQPFQIANFVSHASIQINQKADRPTSLGRNPVEKSLEQRARRIDRTIGFEILSQLRCVLERVVYDSWLQKEIERIKGG